MESLGAAAILGAAFLMGVKWLLAQFSKTAERYHALVSGLVEQHSELLRDLNVTVGRNTAALDRSSTAVEKCDRCEHYRLKETKV